MYHIGITVCLILCWLLLGISQSKLIVKPDSEKGGSSIIECIKHPKWHLKKVAMINREVENFPFANDIIKALSSPVIIVPIDTNFSVETTFVVFSTKRYFYYDLFKRVSVEHKVRVLIMWKWPNSVFKDGTLQDIFSVLWIHQIYDVYVFVEEENSEVKIYTYFPYGECHCRKVGPPLHVDTCNSTTKEFTMKKFMLRETRTSLMKNLYGCPVKVIVKNRPPESVALVTPDDLVTLRGSGGRILSSLMQRYNFTIKIKQAEDDLQNFNRDKFGLAISNYTPKMLLQTLKNDQFDFAFGVFSYLIYFSPEIDFSHYYLNENFAFYVPCGTKKQILSIWNYYYKEFTPSTWACVISVLFFFALILKIIAWLMPKENPAFLSFWGNIFSLTAFHVENSVRCRTVSNTMKIVLTAMMFYCTIMTVAYRASLKSLIVAPWEENSIETWSELEQSNLCITGMPDMYSILKKISKKLPVLRQLRKRFKVITTGEFPEIVDEVTVKRDTAYFGPESMILFYNSVVNEKNGTYKQTICQMSRIVATSPASPFLMRRGSLFIDIINRVTVDLVQTGHKDQYSSIKAVKRTLKRGIKEKQNPLSLEQLKGAFFMWFTGVVIALVILILEMLHSQFRSDQVTFIKTEDDLSKNDKKGLKE